MALTFPASIIPNGMTEIFAAANEREFTSPNGNIQTQSSALVLHEIEFTFPPLTISQRDLVASILSRAAQDDVVMPVYRPYTANAVSGSIKVGSGATAKSLPVTGLNTSYAPKAGRFLSVSTGGRWYLYSLAADSAAGTTSRTFSLTGGIRAAHASGDVVSMEYPYIQGKIASNYRALKADLSGYYNGLVISIRETK